MISPERFHFDFYYIFTNKYHECFNNYYDFIFVFDL